MKYFILPLAILLFLLAPITANAHPGRTASDGCHYCRTNCDDWGEVWNVRHCHGSSTYTTPTNNFYSAPTSTPRPTLRPTPVPTPKPTPIPTRKPTPTPTIAATPTVTSEPEQTTLPETDQLTDNTQEEGQVAGAKDSNPAGGLLSLGFIGGVGYLGYKKVKNRRARK